jgi:hypothetical protein
MHVLIDMIDPRYWNEMMMLAVGRTLPGEVDLVSALEMVDLSDRLSVDEMTSMCSLICEVSAMSQLPGMDRDVKRAIAAKVARLEQSAICRTCVSVPVPNPPAGSTASR